MLGAMLVDATAFTDATTHLVAEDFALDSHQQIYRAILAVRAQGLEPDGTTVMDYLEKAKRLDAIGGVAYLSHLIGGIPRNPKIESYVRIIKEKSLLRQIIREGDALQSEGFDGTEDAETIADRYIERMQGLRTQASDVDLQHVADYFGQHDGFDSMLERMATTQGIRTGIAEFDDATMGYQPKGLTIIAGRPGIGKSAKAFNDAYYAAVTERKTTAVFTLEQDRHDAVRRMLASSAKVPYNNIKSANLHRFERSGMMESQALLTEAPLYITDRSGMTVTRIRVMCEKLKRKGGLDIVFIDQLSRLKSTDVYRKGMMTREVIGEQTNKLKLMAQELDIAVVLLCQLRRHEGKGYARPQLTDLKDSGDLEEDADLCVLLHRPTYYDKGSTDPDEIIIAKNREGSTKTVQCSYNGSIVRWDALDPGAPVQQSLNEYYTGRRD